MLVRELMELLSKQNPDDLVTLEIGWAGDTAFSDKDDEVRVTGKDGHVVLESWMSNCDTTLEIQEGDEG